MDADLQPDLREQAVDADFLDETRQPVARAEPLETCVGVHWRVASLAGRSLTRKQPSDLRL